MTVMTALPGFALGLGLGLGGASLLWWTLFLGGAKKIVEKAIRERSFRYLGTLYFIWRAGEGNLTGEPHE